MYLSWLRAHVIFSSLLSSFTPTFFTFLANNVFELCYEKRTVNHVPATSFFHFPGGNQAENIKPRLNGQILATVNTAPELYQINPFLDQVGGIVHRFEGYTSLFGIVESQPDLFHIIASNFSGAPYYYGYPGSVSIFSVDLRKIQDPTVAHSDIRISRVVDIPQAQLLNGLVEVNRSASLLMSGDSQTGTLYLIDTHRRIATAVFHDALLEGTTYDRTAGLAHVGINGLKYHESYLYFTNTAKGLYGKLPVNGCTGEPAGRPSILANYGTYVDDLSFDRSGNQFISEPLRGILLRPANTTSKRNQTRLLSGLVGANSNAFGRTVLDSCILYSSFAGAPSGVARVDAGKEGFCNGQRVRFKIAYRGDGSLSSGHSE